ncbi:MAG: carboxypeptidase-like regulatory domain-containing protein [Solirubrobacteraceae bacterium]
MSSLRISISPGIFTAMIRGSRRLAVLVVVAVSLAFSPSALAAEETGRITGTVTDASTHAAIEGIEICARPTGQEYGGQCAESSSSGEYTMPELSAGAYNVKFFVPPVGSGSGLDYASQYYSDRAHRSESAEVTVTAGNTTSEINAAMRAGGEIMGVVTDTSTHGAIGGIEVCVAGIEGERARCTVTDANGGYALSALVTGEYIVAFHPPYEGPLDYARQFYNHQASYLNATKVPVIAGSVTEEIDAAMQPGGNIAGQVTAAATGAAVAGVEVCALSISEGSKQRCAFTDMNGEYTLSQLAVGQDAVEFGGQFELNLSYLREYYSDKASLSEANSVSVAAGVTVSDVNASLHATGEESIKPPPVVETALTSSVPTAAPLLETMPLVTLMGSKLVISGNVASVRVVCSKAACRGSIELVAQAASKRHSGRAATARRETLVLATGSFALAEGKDDSVLLHLTAAGRKQLAHASRRHPVTAKLTLSIQSGKTTTMSVLVG